MPRPEDQFHAAIVVDDPAAVKAELSELYGYEWSRETGAPLRLRLPTGETVLNVQCSYSKNAPRLEVIQSIPGTLWSPVPGSRIHHLGYWSDDVPADSAALEDKGYVCEAAGLGDDGVP
ncbi:MAG: VOC family protein, partial [Zavarzinella sp.]|nr:VOC family protein [Zavarzinella sp.]